MSLLSDEEQDTDYQFGDYAEDAVSAVAFTIAARLESDPQQAVWASRRPYDALDEFVTEILDIRSVNRNEEERIVAHPLVQAEFRRQRADLSQLQDLAKNPTRERAGIAELRRRAEMDAKIFFGPESGSFRSSK